MMRTASSPLVSHPPLHLPLTHIRHLSHPRFHFTSSLSAVCAASVGAAPLPHPCCFLTHSTTPTLKLHPSPPSFCPPLPSSLPPFLALRISAHELFTSHLGIFLSSDRSKNLYLGTIDDLHGDINPPPQKKGY